MLITIEAGAGANEDSLVSLYEWLQDDADVRRHAQIKTASANVDPGDMSVAIDIIELIISSGFSAANLALAYATWRDSSNDSSEIIIEKDGARISVRDASPETVASIVETLNDEDEPGD